jgi:transcription initiation factor IIE alpha subunit
MVQGGFDMTNKNRALQLFQKHGQLTDIELDRLLGINPNSVRPLRLQLQREGHIVKTGEKKKHTRGRGTKGYYTIYKVVNSPKLEVRGLLSRLRQINARVNEMGEILKLLMKEAK